MAKPLSVLLIEDSEDDALLITRILKRAGYDLTVKRVDTAEGMKQALNGDSWDVVLSDYVMPNFSAPDALALLKASALDLPFIVVSGAIGEDTAVAVMRAGAHDYLMKDNLARLSPAIEREMQETANRRERKRAEELSSRLGRILDNSSNEIYVFDAATFHFIQANHGACHNLGYTQAELLDRTPLDLQPEMNAAKFAMLLSPLYSGEREQIVFETVQRRHNESTYPIEVRLTLSHSENSPVFVAIAQDITERKRSESALVFMAEASIVLSSTLDYETTFQSVTRLAVSYLADLCVINLLDADGTLSQVAESHAEHVDANLVRRLDSTNITNLPRPNPVLDVLEAGKPYVTNKVSAESITRAIPNDSQRKVLTDLGITSYMALPLIQRERTLGVISFALMSTTRRYGPSELAIAEELARRAAVAIENASLYQEAQQALRLRDQFLSIAAHELKTPLTALLGNTQLLQRRMARETTIAERDERVLNVINQQARRLGRMIEALLDISRIRGGTLSIEETLVDLNALAQRLSEEMQPSLERHSIELHSADKPMIVVGDALRLEQVFQNIIQNAIKYSPMGGKIHVEIAQVGDQACVTVTDQGIGIPSKALPNLFRQFYRADNAQHHQIAGMGLGLYVVREIITLHGGRVEVESAESRGSTFRVFLPRVTDSSGTSHDLSARQARDGPKSNVASVNDESMRFAAAQRPVQ